MILSTILNRLKRHSKLISDPELFERLAEELEKGHVIGWFNGPMEFGPRALGGRSIIGDPRNQKMQSVMNLKIKYRESFRPFAPSVLEEDVSNQFEMNVKSPYMLLVAPVKKELCKKMTEEEASSVNFYHITGTVLVLTQGSVVAPFIYSIFLMKKN